MAANSLIVTSITGSFEMLKMHLADLSDADLMVRPVPAANHAAWQLAHLASFEALIADTIAPGNAIHKPATMGTACEKGAATSDDPAKFPTKAELLALLESAIGTTKTAIGKMTDADLEKPTPEQFQSFAKTLGELAILGPMHANMHMGQIQVIRRALGKPRIF